MTRHSRLTSRIPETACPSLEELASFSDEMPAIAEHLAECVRCRSRLAALRRSTPLGESFEFSTQTGLDEPIRKAANRVRPDSRLGFGAICSVASDERPGERLVVVVIGGKPVKDPMADGPVTVAPISVEREFAAGWDALVDSNELDLAYDCMVEMWNYGQVARVQLDETFGRIHPAAQTRLERMWQETRKGEEVPPVGTHTGPPILGDQDPRLGFERDEIERASAFYTPQVAYVRELAGSLVRLLQERAALGAFHEPALGSAEAEVLADVRGNGFITPPDGNALGHVIRLLEFDVAPGTAGGEALEEEASAWIENENHVPTQMAARDAITWARGAVGRIIGGPSEEDRSAGEIASYITTVRSAASNGRASGTA